MWVFTFDKTWNLAGLMCHGIMAPVLLFWYITMATGIHFKTLYCILPPPSSFFFPREWNNWSPYFLHNRGQVVVVSNCCIFFLKFKSPPIEYLLINNIFVDSHSSLNFISILYVFSAYHSQQSTFRANEIWIIY